MDLRKLKTLIDLVSDSNVSELEITEAEGKIRIVKGGTAVTHQYVTAAAPVAMAAPMQAPASVEPLVVAEPAPVNHTVKSPMVGTFYRAASPEAKSFVEIGDTIKLGQTICIIEAMKILNEIEADRAGVVTQIHCVNGQAVEYGQPLFVIE